MAYELIQDILPSDLAWNGSRGNYSASGNRPTMLIMHATGASTYNSTRGWFRSPKSGVSSHYVIDKNGKVYQQLPESAIAYTAGRSRWGAKTNLNDDAVQIELVNLDDYLDPYPKAQYNAAVELSQDIVRRYNITSENVVSHAQVAIPKGRKKDPAGFDMERFKYDVYSAPYDYGRWGQTTDPEQPINQADDNPVAEKPKETTSTDQRSYLERIIALFVTQTKGASILVELKRLFGVKNDL